MLRRSRVRWCARHGRNIVTTTAAFITTTTVRYGGTCRIRTGCDHG